MNILTQWLRHYLPTLTVSDRQLADDLTLRGIAVEGVHDLGPLASGKPAGSLFEMDITTNRVDAMNHYGVAREAATIYGLPLKPLLEAPPATEAPNSFPVAIDPAAQHLCGRFTARVLRNIAIAPSIGWVSDYFSLLGLKQISNAVDASNFVLHGMGHPTHAFDLDKIQGGILVRLAHKGEKLRLLDGSERTLEPDDLVIADHARAISLAGVMGGWDTMITPETKNILVEAAWFDPAAIRRSSRRHGFHTDASHRFERGADFNACPTANALVSNLVLQSGGQAEGGLIDLVIPAVAARTANRAPIQLSVARVQHLLGTTVDDTPTQSALTAKLIAQYLTSLGCTLTPADTPETFSVQLPSWRLDIEREIDLIEEVARVFGYNRFANTLPTPLPVTAHPTAAAEHAVRTRLLALGFSEAISSTFASEPDAAIFAPSAVAAPLENPLSEEARLLRPSLVSGMAAMIAHNLNRDVRDVRLFEAGATFTGTPDADAVTERESLTLGLTGELPASPLHAAKDAGFYHLKGAVESLLSLFTAPEATWSPETPAWVEPCRGASVQLGGKHLAALGELASSQREARKLRQPVWLAELDLAALLALPLRTPTARELSRFQAVERDFSFTFPDSTDWNTVAAAIHALAIPELTRLVPAEIFRDPKGAAVPRGHHALLVRCTFQSPDRTLTEDELTAASTHIVTALTTLGGIQRT